MPAMGPRILSLLLAAGLSGWASSPWAEAVETPPASPPEASEAGRHPGADGWRQSLAGRPEAAELVWLEGSGDRFPALYREHETARRQGAVILLHDMGANPAWPRVMTPLRRLLPPWGWDVLALELSVPAGEDGKESEGQKTDIARLEAAMAFLQARGAKHIALIGHGGGADLAQSYALGSGPDRFQAVVCISPSASLEVNDAGASLPPLLDVHGERDLPSVLKAVAMRRLAARRAGLDRPVPAPLRNAALMRTRPSPAESMPPRYRSLRISGADHGYAGYEAPLLRRILGWLRSQLGSRRGDGPLAL
ncbi:MAG TPA: DUF3530 family protein [Gammaproteobacteria bacterium]|nr:DUF3530 family protein [Gammaproteobacteria bacterium]